MTLLKTRGDLLRDFVYGANDGLITTFAIVAGATGGNLPPKTILILAVASLFADGFSMASGNYLGVKSEIAFNRAQNNKAPITSTNPLQNGFITFTAFTVIGVIPLLPYILGLDSAFALSATILGLMLFIVGAGRSIFTKRRFLTGGLEMLVIGGVAASTAYLIGNVIEQTLR